MTAKGEVIPYDVAKLQRWSGPLRYSLPTLSLLKFGEADYKKKKMWQDWDASDRAFGVMSLKRMLLFLPRICQLCAC